MSPGYAARPSGGGHVPAARRASPPARPAITAGSGTRPDPGEPFGATRVADRQAVDGADVSNYGLYRNVGPGRRAGMRARTLMVGLMSAVLVTASPSVAEASGYVAPP